MHLFAQKEAICEILLQFKNLELLSILIY